MHVNWSFHNHVFKQARLELLTSLDQTCLSAVMALFVSLHVGLVLAGAESAVKDQRFKIPSENAANARVLGEKLVKWLKDSNSQQEAEKTCSSLVSAIHDCLPSQLSSDKSRETLWREYHKLRCSEKYQQQWQELFQKIGSDYKPILAQYVGDHILDALVKRSTPIEDHIDEDDGAINKLELNALRYAAGYVPRNLQKKLRKSLNPLRRQLQICLWDLLDDEDEGGTADEWIKAIDRGGLTRVNEMTFQVLAIERRVRRHLKVDSCHLDLENVCGEVLEDDDVLFHWSIVSGDWEEEEAEQLLKQIVNLYVTIRGFAFAKAWVEQYKSSTKTSLQKSKGLRKKINTD